MSSFISGVRKESTTLKEMISPNVGITLRDYISDYRKSLIRQRMASGNYNLAYCSGFGLTDEGHVSKILNYRKVHK